MPVNLEIARDAVSRSMLFTGVPAAVAQRALADLELLVFKVGEDVLVEAAAPQGDADAGLYIVIDGQLVASRAMPGGRTQRLSTMAPGDFFGELARLDEGVRSATVTAVTPAVLGRLPGPVADRLVADAPVVMRTIATMIARRLRAADSARVAARLNEERLSMVGKAAAMLAHDLRNPLSVVKNATALIVERIGDPIVWARKSENAAEFMLGMVNDLLNFAKGNCTYAQKPVMLSDVVEDVEAFGLAPLELTGRITVHRFVSGEGTFVGDRRAVSRALLNIIRNAEEAMSGTGTLTFELTVIGSDVRIVVADTGPGIPDHVLGTIFEPFATYGKKGGTGLGMAMTRAAIEEGHGGRITVDTVMGKGTRFTVSLPLKR